MSPKLPIISGRTAVSALEKIGFLFVSQRGSHVKLRNEKGNIVIIPMHDELAKGTLKSILRQADLSVEDFLRLIKH